MLWIWVAGATPLDVEETARSLGAKAADLDVVLDLSAMALEADEADRARLERAILLATALEHAEPPFDEKDRTLCYEVVLGTPESADEAVAAVNKGFLPGAWLIAKLPADLAAAEAPARVPLLKEWLGRRLDEETRAHVAHALGVIEELPADAVPEVVEVVSRMALAAAVAPTSATVSTSSESGSIVDDAKRAALRRYKDERITFTTDSARELRDDYVWVDGESRTMTTFRDRLVWGVSRGGVTLNALEWGELADPVVALRARRRAKNFQTLIPVGLGLSAAGLGFAGLGAYGSSSGTTM